MATANEKSIRVKIELQGVGEFKNQLKEVGVAAKQFGSDIKDVGVAVAQSATKLTALGLAATAVVSKLNKFTKGQADLVKETAKLSATTGVATNTIRVLENAGSEFGITAEETAKGLKNLTLIMTDVKDPASAASKSLDKLSPGLSDVIRGSTNVEDAFFKVIDTLRGVTSETERAEIASKLFGKSSIALAQFSTLSAEQFEEETKKAKEFGLTLTEVAEKDFKKFSSAQNDISDAISGTMLQVAATLAPTLTEITNAFTNFVNANRQGFIDFISLIGSQLTPVITDLLALLNGQELENANLTALAIYNTFKLVKDAVSIAFNTAVAVLTPFYNILDAIAKLVGFGSGAELGLAAAFLQFSGIIKIFLTTISAGASLFNLLWQAIKLGPALINTLALTFTTQGGIIKTAILGIQATWAAAVASMTTVTTVFIGLLSKLRIAITLMWAALTGPVGLIVIAVGLVISAIALLIEKTIGWKNILDGLKVAFDTLKENASIALTAIGDFFLGLGIIISNAFKTAIDAAVATIRSGYEVIKTIFLGIVDAIFAPIKQVSQMILDGITAAVQSVVSIIKAVFDPIFKTISDFISKITTGIKNITAVGTAARTSGGNQSTATVVGAPAFAGGGKVSGPGSATSDSILAKLSNGEYVIRAAAVKKYGQSMMDAINQGAFNLKGFATGGMVELSNSLNPINSQISPVLVGSGSAPKGRPLNLVLPNGATIPTTTTEDTAKRLQRDMRKSDLAKTGKLPRWF